MVSIHEAELGKMEWSFGPLPPDEAMSGTRVVHPQTFMHYCTNGKLTLSYVGSHPHGIVFPCVLTM